MSVLYEEFYSLAGVKQHSEFEKYLNQILFNKDEREKFYKRLLELNNDVSKDSFKPYFELYAAERKSFKQDYTPDAITNLLAYITRSDAEISKESGYSAYDPTAGTGALLISKWYDDMMQESIFSYAPHRYLYIGEELGDNAVPYLLHNMALRGMNAIIIHGDTLSRHIKNIYFVKNSKDDYLGFSDINVMPRSELVENEFDVREWVGDGINHIESPEDEVFNFALPMKRERLKEADILPKFETVHSWKNAPRVKDIAIVERAKKGKIYPKGSIIIQLSATKGQMGLLESDGQIESHYAVIVLDYRLGNETYWFLKLSLVVKWWFNRVKEGLNVPLEEIANMPLEVGYSKKVPIVYGQQSLF